MAPNFTPSENSCRILRYELTVHEIEIAVWSQSSAISEFRASKNSVCTMSKSSCRDRGIRHRSTVVFLPVLTSKFRRDPGRERVRQLVSRIFDLQPKQVGLIRDDSPTRGPAQARVSRRFPPQRSPVSHPLSPTCSPPLCCLTRSRVHLICSRLYSVSIFPCSYLFHETAAESQKTWM